MPRTKFEVQAQTVNQPFRMPLITTFGNRNETLMKDAKLVNCFAEKDMETGDYWISKRVGLAPYKQYSGDGLGVYNWEGEIYSIFSSTFRRGDTVIGTVDTSNGRYKFVELLGSPRKLVFSNGLKMYYTDGTLLSEVKQYEVGHAGYLTINLTPNINDYLGQAAGQGNHYEIIDLGTTDFSECGFSSGTTAGSPITYNGHFVVGQKYVINGNPIAPSNNTEQTQFTEIGASSNEVGTVFVATDNAYSIDGVVQGFGSTRNAAVSAVGERFYATQLGKGTGTAALTAWGMMVGQSYTIRTLGDTDFTQYGAASNTVDTVFTCTKVLAPYSVNCGTLYNSNFPSSTMCKGFVYLDGTLYVMDRDAHIYGSKNLDDPAVWDPLNRITARVEPDRGVSLAKQLVYVIALKEWTSEVFYDAGNPVGSPLAPVAGAKSPYGCVSADSIQEIDDNLYWVSSNRTVSPQIVRMRDLKVEVVSTPPVDRMLDQADFDEVFSWNFKHGGHKFYGVTIRNENLTLVFDIDQGLWYQWTDKDSNYWPIVGETFTPERLHVTQHETNGSLYLMEGDYEYPNDYGNVVPVDIVTSNSTFSVDRRKFLKMMHFYADQTPGSMLSVRVSDDDYQTWSQYRQVNLGNRRPMLYDCGTFYRRAWHLRHFANTPFRIKWVDLQIDLGTL